MRPCGLFKPRLTIWGTTECCLLVMFPCLQFWDAVTLTFPLPPFGLLFFLHVTSIVFNQTFLGACASLLLMCRSRFPHQLPQTCLQDAMMSFNGKIKPLRLFVCSLPGHLALRLRWWLVACFWSSGFRGIQRVSLNSHPLSFQMETL